MSETLRPCPYCGSANVASQADDRFEEECYYGGCNDCGAEGPNANNEQEAIEGWNRRAPVEPEVHPAVQGALDAVASFKNDPRLEAQAETREQRRYWVMDSWLDNDSAEDMAKLFPNDGTPVQVALAALARGKP